MRHLDFDELWRNELFDYKDGDLLVMDDITRLKLSDYENTAVDFIIALFCAEGRMMLTVEEREYRIEEGCLFVYLPGQTMNGCMLSQNAKIKQIFLFTENVPSHVPSPSENTSLLTAE